MPAQPSEVSRYWDAMAPLRAVEPVVPAVASKLEGCTTNLSGSDAMYMSRCLAAWREISARPAPSSAQQVFARDYYRWTQRYLKAALSNRPGASAGAAVRVIWALDVWSRVNYALFALNIAWGEVYRRDTTGALAFTPGILSRLFGAAAQENRWVNLNQKKMIEAYALSSNTQTQRAAAQALRAPIPFGELAVEWVGEGRAQYARKANPLWGLLLDAVRPWSADWHQHWIGSKGGKDRAEVATAAADPAMSVALMQWRLWSVQDFATDHTVTKDFASNNWPLHMGTRFSCATLFQYISAATTDGTVSAVVYRNGRAYPTLPHGLSLLAEYAAIVINTDFDREVSDYLARYLHRFALPFRVDGSQMTRGELAALGGRGGHDASPPNTPAQRDSPAQVPVTYGDYREYLRGLAVIQPPACPPGDKTCELSQDARRKLRKTPAGALDKQFESAMRFAATTLGVKGAVGGGLAPVYGLPNPFARSFADNAYKTAMVGKTVPALARLPVAVANLEVLLPGLFSTGAATQVAPSKACTTYFYGPSDTPCTVCEGEWPACAEHLGVRPGLQRPSAAAQPRNTGPDPAGLACHQQWVAWLHANPAAARCFPLAGSELFRGLCAQVARGGVSADEAREAWQVYASGICPGVKLPRPSALELFGRRLVHAGTLGLR